MEKEVLLEAILINIGQMLRIKTTDYGMKSEEKVPPHPKPIASSRKKLKKHMIMLLKDK